MSLKPITSWEEIKKLAGTDTRLHSLDPANRAGGFTILHVGNESIYARGVTGYEFIVDRAKAIRFYGVEVPDKYAYVNLYRDKGGELYATYPTHTRLEADQSSVPARVGCLKIKLEERFDD